MAADILPDRLETGNDQVAIARVALPSGQATGRSCPCLKTGGHSPFLR
jgi:hypothetical protein